MKKIILGVMALMGLMSLASCDKIAEEDYTVYDGANIFWMTSTETIAPIQRVYVEKYTGPMCNNCPKADQTLSSIHNDRVVMVSINHRTGQGQPFPGDPDMRTDGGTLWDQYFNINAIPAAYINRDIRTQYLGEMSNIVSDIDQALGQAPTIALDLSAVEASGSITIAPELQFVESYPNPITITIALIEDSLVYKQLLPNGDIDSNYAHNHMLRKVITGFWGREVAAKGEKDECLTGSLTYTPSGDIKLENSHIVAFVSDKASRKVLNCASCKID